MVIISRMSITKTQYQLIINNNIIEAVFRLISGSCRSYVSFQKCSSLYLLCSGHPCKVDCAAALCPTTRFVLVSAPQSGSCCSLYFEAGRTQIARFALGLLCVFLFFCRRPVDSSALQLSWRRKICRWCCTLKETSGW